LWGQCNNGCSACANRDHWVSDEALDGRLRAAEHDVALVGREPTMHPRFGELLAREGVVGLVSNGRRIADVDFTRRALGAGLRSASIKLFGSTEHTADSVTRAAGSFKQGLKGAQRLIHGGVACELRVPLYRANLASLDGVAAIAARLGVPVRLEVALDAVGLGGLVEAAEAVERLRGRCKSLGVRLGASPLASATRYFWELPR